MNYLQQIKPKYEIDDILNEYKIIYDDKIYIFNSYLFCKILNFERNFIIYNDDEYPSYKINNKYINFIEFCYDIKIDNYNLIFKNNNKFDLRDSNIIIENKNFKELTKSYNVIENIYNGTKVLEGRYSGEHKNEICKILNKKNQEKYLMLCNRNILCTLCRISYQKIREFENKNNYSRPIIWSYQNNGYILGNNNLFIHQIITGCYGNGKGTKNISVDHIDQDPLNNCYDNLRIATREEQQNNQNGIKEDTKRERKHNAKPLPYGITQNMMKKHVVYYRQCYNREKNLYREFFQIEKHPNLDKIWATTKSEKITILDKLHYANAMIEKLENKTYHEIIEEENKNKISLPQYICLKSLRERDHLIFDKKCEDGHRENLKMILPINYNLEEQLIVFKEKINKKYQHQNIE